EAARSQRDELAERGFMPMVLVVEPKLRRSLSTVFERFGLDIVVLSHAEIDNSITFEHLGAVMIGE
ncbi:MAG: hypothetical protein LBU73_10115, partial [Helicobacteraceae bacterium]|nr:hypothetical protein [Helicobacteraceae bacterium]